jgi:hypothetical protein
MFLALQGLMLLIIGEGGTIGIDDRVDPRHHEREHVRPLAGWILFAIVVGGWALLSLNKMRSRKASGLPDREHVGLPGQAHRARRDPRLRRLHPQPGAQSQPGPSHIDRRAYRTSSR